MAKNVRILHTTPEAVFDVLGDGWLYTTWVVGASRMRKEEAGWPQVGTHLHHSFGSWPFVIDDVTTSLVWDPPHRMVIQPKGWPIARRASRASTETTPMPAAVRKVSPPPPYAAAAAIRRALLALDICRPSLWLSWRCPPGPARRRAALPRG